jgi:hypothetical protein
MAKSAQLAFNRGEVSKLVLSRIDIEKLRLAAECQVNWLPWVVGAMMLRPGLQYIGEIAGSGGGSGASAGSAGVGASGGASVAATLPCKLVRFFFSTSDTALLELTVNGMRVWINDTLVTRASVLTAITDPNFNNAASWDTATGTTGGCTATVGSGQLQLQTIPLGGVAQARQTVTVNPTDYGKEHGLRVTVTRGPVTLRAGSSAGAVDYIAQTTLDAGSHSLAFTPNGNFVLEIETSGDTRNKILTGVSIDPAGALLVPTPWGSTDLGNIRYDQSGDIIFVACYGVQQYKIERRSATSWSVSVYQSDDGPFGDDTPVVANLQVSVPFGIGVVNSDRPYFVPGHIGALFRLFESGQVYQSQLGGNGQFTSAIRVVGVGTTARNFKWTAAGSWTGTLTLQRSFDAADHGFVDVLQTGANGTLTQTDSPANDNQIVYYRVGFKQGDYGGGVASVIFASTDATLNQGAVGAGGAAGLVRCIGFNSATQIQVEVLTPFSSLVSTPDWQEGDWSTRQGYPSSVAFFEGRLYWAGRDRIWGSRPDGFYSFKQEELDNTALGDGGALIASFGSGPVDSVNWLASLTRLLAGREGSIASARSSAFDQVLTPTNFSVKDCSQQGAARLPVLKAGKRAIFVQQSGRRVYELAYNPAAQDYEDHDLTRLNTDIGKAGFTDCDIESQPDRMAFFVRGDGQCAALLYDPEDEVEAWWRIQTLGVIESVCVLPSGSLEDNVYFVVKRVINGITKRFIEKLARRNNCVGGTENHQLDCFIVQTGPTGVAEAPHLPNTTVRIWGDGAYLGEFTLDSNGNFTLSNTYTKLVIGLSGTSVTGSTNPVMFNETPPDIIFTNATPSNTLQINSIYEGYPAEVYADVQGTGKLKHIGPIVVANSAITLPNNLIATTIVAFLGYMAPFQSAKLAATAPTGTTLTERKKLGSVGLVLADTHYQGLKIGQRMDALDPLPLVEQDQNTPVNTIWPQYDEPSFMVPGEFDSDARLCLLAQAPLPATVTAVVISE